MENLKNALNELQSKTIGIAKIYENIELVIESTDYSFTTISIGKLGGVSTNHYPKPEFTFKKFDNSIGTLSNFLETPQAFYNWYNENFK